MNSPVATVASSSGLVRLGRVEREVGEEQHRELQQVVVERAQELDDEQRAEAALAEQREIRCGHAGTPWARA